MKDRLTTLVLAAAALMLFYVFFFPKPMSSEQDLSLPLSTEEGDGGYQALWRWLKEQHVAVATLRLPYTHLSASTSTLAGSGNLLITTMPHRVPARNAELNDLDQWIDKGNTLMIMAALDDTPPWAIGASEGLFNTLGRMTRIKFEASNSEAKADAEPAAKHPAKVADLLHVLEPRRIMIEPMGAHPLLDGVQSVLATSEFPASHWLASPMDAAPVLAIAHRQGDDRAGIGADPVLWLKPQGRGQILVFSVASPFTNHAIAEKDNAQLFSNIVAWSVSGGGAVIFDDDHQGAVSYYDAKAFFRDPRLHRTLFWIVALWLLFVLGAQRLRSSEDDWDPADVTAFLGATGSFFASSLTPADAARQLFHNFFNSVRRDFQLPEDGTPLWERLGADARVDPSTLARLQRLYARTRSGKNVDLIQLHNTLSRLQGILE